MRVGPDSPSMYSFRANMGCAVLIWAVGSTWARHHFLTLLSQIQHTRKRPWGYPQLKYEWKRAAVPSPNGCYNLSLKQGGLSQDLSLFVGWSGSAGKSLHPHVSHAGFCMFVLITSHPLHTVIFQLSWPISGSTITTLQMLLWSFL